MKKIAGFLIFAGMLSVSVFAQTNGEVRPRVVKLPTNKPVVSSSPADTSIAPPPPLPVIDEDDVIKIETKLVKLPVSVSDDKGRFVSGLGRKDFQIFENGNKQQIEYFATLENPFTVVLLLDLSPSTKYKISEIQDAAISFFDELRGSDRLIVVTFSQNAKVLSNGNTSYHRVRRAIRRVKFGKKTSLYDSVDFAMNKVLKTIEGRKAIVIFSDGVDTSSRYSSFNRTIKDAEKGDTLIYSVRYNTFIDHKATQKNIQYGIGGSPEEHRRGKLYLRNLASFSGGRMYEADTTLNVNNAFKNIAEELRRQYAIGYYPENEGEVGERRKINVRVMRPNLSVRAKNSYIVEAKEPIN